jgi:hypothetical protein
MTMWATGPQFEDEVRRIARALWGTPDGDGAGQLVDGRERDCIFEMEDVTHYIESTRKRTLEKVRDDAQKMVKYRVQQMKRHRLVKLWIVTEHEPTPDQRTEAKKHEIEILSLSQFERKILDADGYMELRLKYRFGSATDPDTDSPDVSKTTYQATAIRDEAAQQNLSVAEVAAALAQGRHVLLLGDYGMGKSLTLREVFRELRRQKVRHEIRHTPVLLNLRDHWGQRSPAEALERHAREIGFNKPAELVRALNAGRLIVMLDGFDETASIQWAPRESSRLREARNAAVLLAKKFVEAQHGVGGVIVAGRDHFFDSRSEMYTALGIRASDLRLVLDGFSVAEMRAFLTSRGIPDGLPDWLPNRPLLLAYLTRENLLADVLRSTENAAPSQAWEQIIERICAREASIHEYLGADSIRQILERLASSARSTTTGLGPVMESDIFDAFRRVTQMDADEVAKPLLMRLPGLSSRDQVQGGRSFLDDEMLDVLRAGAVADFARMPYIDPHAAAWKHGLGPSGVELAARKLSSDGKQAAPGRAVAAAREAVNRWRSDVLALDLVTVAKSCSDAATLDCAGLTISNAAAPSFDLSEQPIPTGLVLDSVAIDEFIAPLADVSGLTMRNCIFARVFGYQSASAFPSWMSDCDAVDFDDASTNAEILRTERMPLPVRVALTILRKLFRQRGHGRKEKALWRGMDQIAQRWVPKVLPILKSEGLAFDTTAKGTTLWHPVQGQRRRANEMLDAPDQSHDPFLIAVRAL